MRISGSLPFVLALTLMLVQPGFSQTTEEIKGLKDEIKALKEGQTAIKKDLQEIKNVLRGKQAQPEFKEAIINIEGAPFTGDKHAKLVLMEFSDYQ